TSYPNRPHHPGMPGQQQAQRRSMEIGPGSSSIRSLCDLCGRNPALIKCQYCSGQIFCMACDDMYHKHPKR
ncbi:Uncharacterized protein FKW44_001219, partial [Caligus rogercresseyi]